MPRTPEPWPWDARQGWYAWIDNSRRRLGSYADGITKAKRRLRELLAEAESGSGEAPLVGELIVDYLQHLRARREAGEIRGQTKADAERRIAGFAELHGDRRADGITPAHLDDWLATKTAWGPTARHDGVGAVKTLFRWAARKGRIPFSPLAAAEKPRRKAKRDRIPSADAVARAFAAVLTPELRDLLAFVYATGCRPKEARTLEAKHLDRVGMRAVQLEHKTAHKTGRERVIYLTPAAAAIAVRLAEAHPEGPIFRNSEGNAWTSNAVGLAVRRLRARAGLGTEVVAYGLRHGYITDALAKRESPALVAELVGHADLRMLSCYSHLSDRHEELARVAAAVRPSPESEANPSPSDAGPS